MQDGSSHGRLCHRITENREGIWPEGCASFWGIVNCSDQYKLLKKNKEIAWATPVKKFLPDEAELTPPASVNVCEVSEASSTDQTDKVTVPPHLKDTFKNSIQHLSPEEQIRLAELQRENENIFPKDQFDLGNFTTIEHGIGVPRQLNNACIEPQPVL